VEVPPVTSDKDATCVNCDIKFEITTNPAGHEGEVSWTGGGNPATGSGKTFTTKWADPGVKTVTATCGTSNKSKEVKIVKVEINPASSIACDGEAVNVDLVVTPANAKDNLNNVQFTATKPGGGVGFDNPSGQGITLSQRGDITQWRIDNTRWYSTQADHCNATSGYEIKATYKADNTQCEATPPVDFTADTTFGTCLDGEANVTQAFSGVPVYTTVFNDQTKLWETTVAQGTFVRNVQATNWCLAPANSQYRNMVCNEEQYHEQQQMENPGHSRWGTAFLAANIMNTVQANQPYTHTVQAQSLALAQQAFIAAQAAEEQRSWNYLNRQDVICDDEREAKNAVNASHRCTLPCTYPGC
jgi:hypothetical protein